MGIFRSSNKIHIHGVFQTPQQKERAQRFRTVANFEVDACRVERRFHPQQRKTVAGFQ